MERGVSLSAYIRSVKAQRMKELLSWTDMRRFEISDSLGFERPDSASRFFKRATRVSMREYRGRLRGEELRRDMVTTCPGVGKNGNFFFSLGARRESIFQPGDGPVRLSAKNGCSGLSLTG